MSVSIDTEVGGIGPRSSLSVFCCRGSWADWVSRNRLTINLDEDDTVEELSFR